MTRKFHDIGLNVLPNVSLIRKVLIFTLLIGVIVGGILDLVQTRKLKSILDAQLYERLRIQAQQARIRFDNYITVYDYASHTIISSTNLRDYLIANRWLTKKKADVKSYYIETPPWLPDASMLRKHARIYYALLIDNDGKPMEIYYGTTAPMPKSLINPDRYLLQISSDQSYITEIDGIPFVISSESIASGDGKTKNTLMLASPLDNEFLVASQGMFSSQNIVALFDEKNSRVIASSNSDLIPNGKIPDDLANKHIIIGKSFFDYGGSDVIIQFAALIPREEYDKLGKEILSTERQQRAITVFSFILLFSLIMIWITQNIKKLSLSIVEFSRQTLGLHKEMNEKGDELRILKERFTALTEDVVLSRHTILHEKHLLELTQSDLETRNTEIEEHRRKLELAINEISRLIQSVVNNKGFDVRFDNPFIEKCHEIKNCDKIECPCNNDELPERCWQIAGTYCLGEPSGKYVDVVKDCANCEVYKTATLDPVYQIGELFNNMMNILESNHKELEKAYSDLKSAQSHMLQREKMASIGQLAAGVAHEINNPIGFILSNLGSFARYLAKIREFIQAQSEAIASLSSAPDASEIEAKRKALKIDFIMEDLPQLINESLDGAERVKNIVQTMKNFARLDEAEYKMANINNGIESTITILWNDLKYKVTLKKEYGEIPLTICNPGEINQVFMNLIANAAQAIEKQGEIAIKTWNDDEFIHIAISDTGVGIPEDKIGKIFDPFFTTKAVGEGTGLGLSIAYDIIKKHKGDLKVISEVGKGTTFNVSIPIIMNLTEIPRNNE